MLTLQVIVTVEFYIFQENQFLSRVSDVIESEVSALNTRLTSSRGSRRRNPRSGCAGCTFPRGPSTLSRGSSTVATEL
jgi:hypothetical protein